jgi:1,5-anhydro-D-fructose reductase (1,5-anhydro-D-mannitol-forming)
MAKNWGIVGVGSHVNVFIAPAMSTAANTKIVAVCDTDNNRAKVLAEKYNVAKTYDSYEKMLNDPDLEVLYLATPNHVHAEQVIKAAQAGKHILCEKPMALNAAECEKMIEACDKNKVKLAIGFQSRFNPAIRETRRLVMEGMLGEIPLAKSQGCHYAKSLETAPSYPGAGRWRMSLGTAGAGSLVGIGTHFYDALRFMLNSEIEELISLCEPHVEGALDEMHYVILKFANGTRGVVVTGIKVPRSDNGTVLYGIKAKINCRVTEGPNPLSEVQIEGDNINSKINYPAPDMFRNQRLEIEDLNRCIDENVESISSGRNGLQMVKISNAILESSRLEKPIKIT